MKYIAIALAIALLLDALRLRSRLGRLRALPPRPADSPGGPGGTFLVVDDVTLDAETRRDALAYARAEGLGLLDLVPRELPALDVVDLARTFDPRSYRADPLSVGRTAQHAALVATDVAERAGIGCTTFHDRATFVGAVERLKKYAGTASDIVVASSLLARSAGPAEGRRDVLEAIHGLVMVRALMAVKLSVLGVVVLGLALPGARSWGLITLSLFHLQPFLAVVGTLLRPRDLLVVTLFRLPIELWNWTVTMLGEGNGRGHDAWEQARPVYEKLLEKGTAEFFEPRRLTCPLCESKELVVHQRSSDLIQLKPGRFTLERCRQCGHVFQNPRLSMEGLSFYYRDAYNGLFGTTAAKMFSGSERSYRDRAKMVRGLVEPRRWLDVGSGHAHFCVIARKEWPETRFDVLDSNEDIEEAVRCGWADHAYAGLFPALAPSFEGEYDVVSMSHYLEHTTDPKAEIAAARRALAPGGCLLIEVPDPASGFARLLGRWWGPWVQPQHLHFLSTRNLEEVLRDEGFEALAWQRAEAHVGAELTGAMILILNKLGPPPNLPWKPRGSRLSRLGGALVWLVGLIPLILASWADIALKPLIGPLGLANTYRVVARSATSASPS